MPNDLAVVVVVIIRCDACLYSLSSGKTTIRKKLDSSWTTETLYFDVLGQSDKFFKRAYANTAAKRVSAGISEICLPAQGRARQNISTRRECVDVPKNNREDFVGRGVNS